MYTLALFDLDGTITDPGEGITNSVAFALEKFNIIVPNHAELYRFIGPPLQESFKQFYGLSEEKTMKAVSYYREYYGLKGIFENKVYNGICEVLLALRATGTKVVLATSKPELYALQILHHFNLFPYFDCVCGSNMDGTRAKKTEVISYALSRYPNIPRQNAIMIGDREHDIIGARTVGIDSIGVTYGYGSYDELSNAGATYICNESSNILSCFA